MYSTKSFWFLCHSVPLIVLTLTSRARFTHSFDTFVIRVLHSFFWHFSPLMLHIYIASYAFCMFHSFFWHFCHPRAPFSHLTAPPHHLYFTYMLPAMDSVYSTNLFHTCVIDVLHSSFWRASHLYAPLILLTPFMTSTISTHSFDTCVYPCAPLILLTIV